MTHMFAIDNKNGFSAIWNAPEDLWGLADPKGLSYRW
jgi:hypothetical protein